MTPRVEGLLIAVAGGSLVLSLVTELIEPSVEKSSLHVASAGVACGAIIFAGVATAVGLVLAFVLGELGGG